jgi:hypothetical protein
MKVNDFGNMKSLYLIAGETYNQLNENRLFYFQAGEMEQHQHIVTLKEHIKAFYSLTEIRLTNIENIYFDSLLNRFVEIRIHRDFVCEDIIESYSIAEFKLTEKITKSLLDEINHKYSFNLHEDDINHYLYKLIVISDKIRYGELIKYLTGDTYIADIELWKVTHFHNNSFTIEEIENKKPIFLKFDCYDVYDQPKFKIANDRTVLKEEDFFSKGKLEQNVIAKYYLLIEFLRYHFRCQLELYSGSEGLDILTYDEYTSLEYHDDDEDKFEPISFIIIDVLNVNKSYDLRLRLWFTENTIKVTSYILVRDFINQFKDINNHYMAKKFHYPFLLEELIINKATNLADLKGLFNSVYEKFKFLKGLIIELNVNLKLEKDKNNSKFEELDDLPF